MDVTLIARDSQGARPPDPRVFDGGQTPASESPLADLRATFGGAGLAAPPVVLPDFHHKSNMEVPSSVAVATRDSIRPTLTSASVNCGMALIALNSDRPARAGLEEFYRRVRERYPYPPSRRPELSAGDVLRCATEGGVFAVDRFGAEESILERVEESGTIDLDRWGGADRLRREVPWLVVLAPPVRVGLVGPPTHLLQPPSTEKGVHP